MAEYQRLQPLNELREALRETLGINHSPFLDGAATRPCKCVVHEDARAALEANQPEPSREAALANVGVFWGGWYGDDPATPTWRWLRSDGAGFAWPVTPEEQDLIGLFVRAPGEVEAR